MNRPETVPVLILLLLLLTTAAGSSAVAQTQTRGQKLPEGPGADLVQAKCALCHDLGNVMSIRQTREEWQETIKVMIRRGAPITPEEETIILEYLAKHYGK